MSVIRQGLWAIFDSGPVRMGPTQLALARLALVAGVLIGCAGAGSGSGAGVQPPAPAWRINVNHSEAPYNRQRDEAPALSDAEIDELIAFLARLRDGLTP